MKVRHKQTGAVYLLRDCELRHSEDPRTTEPTMDVEDAIGEVRTFLRSVLDYIDEPAAPEPRWQDVTGECEVSNDDPMELWHRDTYCSPAHGYRLHKVTLAELYSMYCQSADHRGKAEWYVLLVERKVSE